jgi:hypothetical protein
MTNAREAKIDQEVGKEDQPNLIDTEEGQIFELIARIRTLVSIPYREKLATLLITLYIDAKEADETNAGISLAWITPKLLQFLAIA